MHFCQSLSSTHSIIIHHPLDDSRGATHHLSSFNRVQGVGTSLVGDGHASPAVLGVSVIGIAGRRCCVLWRFPHPNILAGWLAFLLPWCWLLALRASTRGPLLVGWGSDGFCTHLHLFSCRMACSVSTHNVHGGMNRADPCSGRHINVSLCRPSCSHCGTYGMRQVL